MEQVMMEAAQIEGMTNSEGWKILRKYLDNTIKLSHDTWLYTSDKKIGEDLKRNARTYHAMINLVENFKEEGKKLFNLWARAQGFIPSVTLDMDNESPKVEED
jgi:hypothetical protein